MKNKLSLCIATVLVGSWLAFPPMIFPGEKQDGKGKTKEEIQEKMRDKETQEKIQELGKKMTEIKRREREARDKRKELRQEAKRLKEMEEQLMTERRGLEKQIKEMREKMK